MVSDAGVGKLEIAFVYQSGSLQEYVRREVTLFGAGLGWTWEKVPLGDLLNFVLRGDQPQGQLNALSRHYQVVWRFLDRPNVTVPPQVRDAWGVVTVGVTEVFTGVHATRTAVRFIRWVKQNRYVWIRTLTGDLALVDQADRKVEIPTSWQALVGAAVTPVTSPAVSYAGNASTLCWVELLMGRMVEAKLQPCKVGHVFLWQGRRAALWCPEHKRERKAHAVRLQQLSKELRTSRRRDRARVQARIADRRAKLWALGVAPDGIIKGTASQSRR